MIKLYSIFGVKLLNFVFEGLKVFPYSQKFYLSAWEISLWGLSDSFSTVADHFKNSDSIESIC